MKTMCPMMVSGLRSFAGSKGLIFLSIDEFANADYIGNGELPWKGTQGKYWLGALWMPNFELTKTSNAWHCYRSY